MSDKINDKVIDRLNNAEIDEIVTVDEIKIQIVTRPYDENCAFKCFFDETEFCDKMNCGGYKMFIKVGDKSADKKRE